MDKASLEKKLEGLLARKAELESRLGMTRAGEKRSTRKSDTKFRVNSGRAVQARAKKSEKLVLGDADVNLFQRRECAWPGPKCFREVANFNHVSGSTFYLGSHHLRDDPTEYKIRQF